MLEGQSLVPTTEDIYFLTGLSRRGEPVNFQTFPAGPSKVSELIAEYCEAGTDRRGSSVPISKIINLTLQTILLLIGRITDSAVVHQASRTQMNYVIQCMNAQIFYWSTTLLECMKRQLTDCRQRTQRNFRFRTILCSFFFKRVSCFSPQLQSEDIWPLSPQYADGQCYYHNRVAEGPLRPSTMIFLLGCHDTSLLSRTTHMRGSTFREI
jgi:hypothetical protein